MKFMNLVISFLSMLFIVTSCGANYKFKIETPKKTTLNNTIQIAVSEKNEKVIDSVQFFINGKVIISNDQNTTVYTNDFGIGKHLISAMVFYPEGTQKVNNSFEVFAEKAYDIYTYKIINEYPHDPKAYTQGLEYYNGFLYESTGKKGESTLRKVAIETGEVLQQIVLDKKYFGEGITIFNDEIFWLTWQNKKGFIYDLATFTKKGEFSYSKSKEGWGFTHNNSELIKSDGTNKIWFLDPITKKEKRAIQVYTDSKTIKDLNELEYVNGKIYANYWKNPLIAIINPSNGTVEGIANLTGLQKEMEKTQKLADQDEVLNGIAYDAQNNRLFVTGKHWGKLFEIELIKKQ